ncbi:MAG TPA: hypothetical protein VHS74_13850 [Solirubrobacterales bacterium]|jgi:hypothetical protein|nr:hypothetical protein [Solirubrobacterales bacterium]
MKASSVRLIPLLVFLAALASATTALAAPASGEGFAVSGKQTVVNEEEGTYKMRGGLVGEWKITSFKELPSAAGVFKAKGTESFKGCIDRKLDGSCTGDPDGSLKFSFRYWGRFSKEDKVELGTCAHPVTGGGGAFAGATGFLMMVDLPTKKAPFSMTEYEGVITLAGQAASARASALPHAC